MRGRSGPKESPGLTGRGWALVAAAALMALSGALFGIGELYPLAAVAAVVVAAAWGQVSARQWSLAVTRLVVPPRVQAGAAARVELSVRNTGRYRTPPLEAFDPFDAGRRTVRFGVAPLAPRQIRQASYRLAAPARGVYRLGPLRLRYQDALGLAQRSLPAGAETTLIVHPRYELLGAGVSSGDRDDDGTREEMLFPSGEEFFGLREYVPGDDLRLVHWPSTARRDDLVIRQAEGRRRGRVTLVVDLHDRSHTAESLEEMLSAAASLAVSGLREGLEVRMLTTGGFDSGLCPSPERSGALLDALARAALHRGPALVSDRVASGAGHVIVLATDRTPAPVLAAGKDRRAGRAATLVVFQTGTDPGGETAGIRGQVVVSPGRPFRQAWEARQVARC